MQKIHCLLICAAFLFALVVPDVCLAGASPLSVQESGVSLAERFEAAGLRADFEWITMRDGTRLAATVAKPFWGEPFPTILVRTPYDRDELDMAVTLISLAGYAVVVQDMRGRYDSEGEDRVFQDDGWGENQDGYDTVEWIAARSWSNGKVGTWGPSALGIVQGLMAGAAPPHLTCQAIGYAATQGYGQAAYQGGAFRQSLVNGWLAGQDSLHMLPDFMAHTTKDWFWDQYDVESRFSSIDAPSLFIGGFYDPFLQGTINDFVGRQTIAGEAARGNNRLILGPWTHVNEAETEQGELTYPTDSTISYMAEVDLVLEWFDYWLKGDDNDVLDGKPVRYFLMGAGGESGAPGNEWRKTPEWPPAANWAQLYLQPDGSLEPIAPGSDGGFTQLVYDPQNPLPTHGGANLEIDAGPYDQSSLEAREDLITFTTEPLTLPLEVAGPVSAVIYASCNLSDMDLSVRLSDVYPDGRSMLVCDGILRAGFRDGFEERVPLTPGLEYRYEIDLWSTAVAFNTGHRIRLSIGHSNYPRFDLNPQYAFIGQDGYPQQLQTEIMHNASSAGYLRLPVIAPGVGEHPLLPDESAVESWWRH